jgi:hypothetical protein
MASYLDVVSEQQNSLYGLGTMGCVLIAIAD